MNKVFRSKGSDMKTALVTGAAGFTGRYMVSTLRERGYRVVGLTSANVQGADERVCDLTDRAAVRAVIEDVRPDYAVHLAAKSFVGSGDHEAFYKINVFGTLNLLEALAQAGVHPAKVLIASSANVYGTPVMDVIDESVCPAPVNHYANSKLAMEHMVRTWFDQVPIVITRPFNYTGPGQDERFLIPKIVNRFRCKASFIELGNLDVSRDFSDVRDVVAIYVALLESHAESEIVNVCSGRAIALRRIIELMNDMAGYDIDVRVNQAYVRTNEIPRLRGSNDRLRALIGFVPKTSIEETLRTLYEAVG